MIDKNKGLQKYLKNPKKIHLKENYNRLWLLKCFECFWVQNIFLFLIYIFFNLKKYILTFNQKEFVLQNFYFCFLHIFIFKPNIIMYLCSKNKKYFC